MPDLTPLEKELLEALRFVSKYADMRESKANALPSQLVGCVRKAIARAESRQEERADSLINHSGRF